MIDGVELGQLERRADEGWIATIRIGAECPYFAGHFPGDPIVPAIGQIAIVAQALEQLGERRTVAGLDAWRLRGPIRPGAQLRLIVCAVELGWRFELLENDRALSSGRLRYQ